MTTREIGLLRFLRFFPDDNGSLLIHLNAWSLRGEGMLTRINAKIQTLQIAYPGIQLEIGNAALFRTEIVDLTASAESALNQVVAIAAQDLRATQDTSEIAFNQQNAKMDSIIANATEAFRQQREDLEKAHSLAMKGERNLREQLGQKFVDQHVQDQMLHDYLTKKFADLDAKVNFLGQASPGPTPVMGAGATTAMGSTIGVLGQASPTTAAADTWQTSDPWQSAAAATAHLASPGTMPPGLGAPKPLRIDHRDWNQQKPLDTNADPGSYLTWTDRAKSHLSKDSPDVADALKWAETQSDDITSIVAENLSSFGWTLNGYHSNFVLCQALKLLLTDSLCTRGHLCEGNGLELWRRLHCEWQGASAQVNAAKLTQYMHPKRCTSKDDLWERLPAWERLASELELGGLPLEDTLKGVSLDELVPIDMKKTIDERVELTKCADKMNFVKMQMHHAKTNKLKNYYSGAGKGPEDDPMGLGNVAEPPAEKAAPPSLWKRYLLR